MANISENISKIRKAIYGKDVRGALADGLDAVNKETEAATTALAAMATNTAGNTFSNPGNRVDNIEKSIQKAVDKKNIWKWVLGYIDANTGSVVQSGNTRLITADICYTDQNLVISMDDFTKYNIAVQYYSGNADNLKTVDTGWLTTGKTINKGSYFRILLRYQDNSAINPALGELFDSFSVRFDGDIVSIGETLTTVKEQQVELNEISQKQAEMTKGLAFGTSAMTAKAMDFFNYNLVHYTEKATVSRGAGALTDNTLLMTTILADTPVIGGKVFTYNLSLESDNPEVRMIVRIGFKDSSGNVLVRNDIDKSGYGQVISPSNAAFVYMQYGYGGITANAFNGTWSKISLFDGYIELNEYALKIPSFENNLFRNLPSATRYAGHRGASYLAPENSLASFDLAGQKSYVFAIETDVRDTADGKLVCFHDDTVDRMTNGTGLINSFTYDQLKSLIIDAGNNVASYPNQQIPSLEEYLKICRKYGKVPLIELKEIVNLDTIDLFVQTLKKYGFEYNCMVQSFNFEWLYRVRKSSRNIHLGFLIDTPTMANIDFVANIGNCGISSQTLTESIVQYAHEKGLSVCHYVRDSTEQKNESIEMGVDVVLTNTL